MLVRTRWLQQKFVKKSIYKLLFSKKSLKRWFFKSLPWKLENNHFVSICVQSANKHLSDLINIVPNQYLIPSYGPALDWSSRCLLRLQYWKLLVKDSIKVLRNLDLCSGVRTELANTLKLCIITAQCGHFSQNGQSSLAEYTMYYVTIVQLYVPYHWNYFKLRFV